MAAKPVVEEMKRIRKWPVEWQLQLAERLNSLTWRDQWEMLCERIHRRAKANPISDQEIDAVVRAVRKAKPLHQR
ncbi:MAG: hypothetical protein FJ279_06060 [Planctomycetes bacterium]|nr:hypothetical protein [Planctomycetota bacterium]MBM4078567.1 hypothetical protein [Planctomycetota bacterium]